jgi:hypothetical protein
MTGQVGRFRMRRVALAWLTCGMLGGLVAFAALPASASIRIGIIGDQTGAADLDKAYAVLQQGVDALKSKPSTSSCMSGTWSRVPASLVKSAGASRKGPPS